MEIKHYTRRDGRRGSKTKRVTGYYHIWFLGRAPQAIPLAMACGKALIRHLLPVPDEHTCWHRRSGVGLPLRPFPRPPKIPAAKKLREELKSSRPQVQPAANTLPSVAPGGAMNTSNLRRVPSASRKSSRPSSVSHTSSQAIGDSNAHWPQTPALSV